LPFGELFIEERTTWNTPYKFSAKELDGETGYSYFGARYYDPNISIWLSVDPLSDKYPGHSPYVYTLNNPIMFIDPDGRYTWFGASWRRVRDGGSKLYKIGNDWAYNVLTKDKNGVADGYATKVGSKIHQSKNWGGINWFTTSGPGGEQETRKTFSDVFSEKIDVLLQAIGLSGGAKTTSKGPSSVVEEATNAAKDINNVQNLAEGILTLGEETGLLPKNDNKEKDPNEMIRITHVNPETGGHGIDLARRRDSTEAAQVAEKQGLRVYNIRSQKNEEE